MPVKPVGLPTANAKSYKNVLSVLKWIPKNMRATPSTEKID
jgi:hypothetical protein